MKVFVALLALAAVANSSLLHSGLHPVAYGAPSALTYGAAPALTYGAAPALTYGAAPALTYGAAPALTYAAPAYYNTAPAVHIQPQAFTYSAKPVAYEANFAHPGYVAVTPGATHIAPLPYPGASHHVNLAKAPGTK